MGKNQRYDTPRKNRQTAQGWPNGTQWNSMACKKRCGVSRYSGTIWNASENLSSFECGCRLRKPLHWQHIHQGTPAECECKKGAVNSENNQFIGKSRGGKATKIHAIVDALGNPMHFMLTGGQVHDTKVECFFNKLKAFRRVATRYDKLASSFLAFVHLAAICILLK